MQGRDSLLDSSYSSKLSVWDILLDMLILHPWIFMTEQSLDAFAEDYLVAKHVHVKNTDLLQNLSLLINSYVKDATQDCNGESS